MKFDITNRFTGNVQFTAEIDCSEDASVSIKIGLAVRWAVKTDAYLTGANLTGANLAGANLTGANLTGANLTGTYLTGANLTGANLADADLAGANLTRASLRSANLRGANLAGANLAGANLTGANLIPKIEKIDSAILAAIDAGGKLDMGNWHKCGTTHCRAGWAIHIAGDAGYALEKKLGSSAAGALIYAKSRPEMPVPDFHCSNETALADLRACAAAEVSVS